MISLLKMIKTMLIGFLSPTINTLGKSFDAPELKAFMTKVRHLVLNSHDTKTLLRKFDSEEKYLAGYDLTCW